MILNLIKKENKIAVERVRGKINLLNVMFLFVKMPGKFYTQKNKAKKKENKEERENIYSSLMEESSIAKTCFLFRLNWVF